jgi:hypothetical protein
MMATRATERQVRILARVQSELGGVASYGQFQPPLGYGDRAVAQIATIRSLLKKGLIEPTEHGKEYTPYRLTPAGQALADAEIERARRADEEDARRWEAWKAERGLK